MMASQLFATAPVRYRGSTELAVIERCAWCGTTPSLDHDWTQPALFIAAGYGESQQTRHRSCACGLTFTSQTGAVRP